MIMEANFYSSKRVRSLRRGGIMLWECVFYAAVYLSSDRGVRFEWESIFGVAGTIFPMASQPCSHGAGLLWGHFHLTPWPTWLTRC